ncbi:MAG: 23S rRNA (adenine(2503)-C(2))-methyltransferase RlmN [Pirellulales bacterium]|nr:23S rRNA (adenine(2503)-C(2))-methyltransferase RlmN [Pirellulales bacterium]
MPIDIYDQSAVQRLRADLAIGLRQYRGFRTQFFKHFAGSAKALEEIPSTVREKFSNQVVFHSLVMESRHDSSQDGATKLVFRTPDQYRIESVILRTVTGRTALCLSSQVGCKGACSFCATSQMGIAVNLNPAAMLDQLVQANELLQEENRRVRNIVFMGMGEPFHNECNVYQVLELLLDPGLFYHPPRYLLVSTVGIPDAMIRFARRFPGVNIALSLHSPRQEIRERIIPLAKRYPVDILRAAIECVNGIQGRPLFIEYLMLAGINDSADDADALIAYLKGLHVHVNLIPYNPIDVPPGVPSYTGPPRAVRDSFAERLKVAGLTTTIRYSLGSDIAAACGQLACKENRRKTAS